MQTFPVQLSESGAILPLNPLPEGAVYVHCNGFVWTVYFPEDSIPGLLQPSDDPLIEPGWLGLYEDLESSALLDRIVADSIQFPQIAVPLNLLIILITSTRNLDNLQGRLDLVVQVLDAVGKNLTTSEAQWLNSRLQNRGFTQSV